jgi:hypothetical protein
MKTYDELKWEVEQCEDLMKKLKNPPDELIEKATEALMNNGAEGTIDELESDVHVVYYTIINALLNK